MEIIKKKKIVLKHKKLIKENYPQQSLHGQQVGDYNNIKDLITSHKNSNTYLYYK